MSDENLSTLAKICDTAQKVIVPMTDSTETIQGWTGLEAPLSRTYSNSDFNEYGTPQSLHRDTNWYIFPRSYSAPSVSNDSYHNITAVDLHANSSKEISQQHSDILQPSLTFVLGNYSACHDQNHSLPMCPLTSTDFPTPPPTPDSHIEHSLHPPLTPCHDNPLQKNAIAYALFQQYLEEKWPKDSLRIGGGVIRAALYVKITNTLLGGVAPARLRQWVKRSQFFLPTSSHSSHTDFGARLAVPGHRVKAGGTSSTRTTGGKAKYTGNNHYRLVAQLEDFVHIIGYYHNDKVGHHGIRKTHALIHKDFSHLPRTAVSKFIELCDICSIHKSKNKKNTSPGQSSNKRNGNATVTEAKNGIYLNKTVHQDDNFTNTTSMGNTLHRDEESADPLDTD